MRIPIPPFGSEKIIISETPNQEMAVRIVVNSKKYPLPKPIKRKIHPKGEIAYIQPY